MMIKEIADAAARLFSLTSDLKQNKEDVKSLKAELKDVHSEMRNINQRLDELSRVFERLAYETKRVQDNDEHERRILALQLENALLKFERRLPPPKSEE